jgi:uncharacterized protein (DUF1800 family)
MRRAGFGATREELEDLASRPYEDLVEDLVHPERLPEVDADIVQRYYVGEGVYVGTWMYRMVATKRPLEEKMALFWHHVFATGTSKNQHLLASANQIDMFRRVGLSDLRTILVELSRDPAMIFWLDNNENRKDEPNENFGRELLELFSMGVGNYTEQDIKNAARAFTGWTFTQPIPLYTQGYYAPSFIFRDDDHDDSEKTFLGETGRFNGEDIIEIIVKQSATARFIARHLYNFFVADEPQVPAWEQVPPRDPEAIDTLVKAYFDSNGELRSVLRVLLNSGFFKEARFKRVKSPTELVTGVIKLVGTFQRPEPSIMDYTGAAALMGQQLLNPPTVEGWHTGNEWIDGGALNERVNFAVGEVGDASKPGISAIIDRISADGGPLSADELVDRCLDFAGPLTVGTDTRSALLKYASSGGELGFGSEAEREKSASRIVRMMQLVVSTKEYQFA